MELAELYRGLPGYHDEEEGLAFPREYIGWRPGDDYMSGTGEGWASNQEFATWDDFGWVDGDDDLNLVADFHFSVTHESKPCTECDQSGYNTATKRISDDFYDFGQTGRRWCDAITQDQVNAWERKRGLGHDAINRWILIETRARRLGVWGTCPLCDGSGSIRLGPDRLTLYVWMLHPRKGCGRGVTIHSVAEADLPGVRSWLRRSFEKHREHFAWALA